MWTFEQIYNGALDKVEDAQYPGIYKVYMPKGFDIVLKQSTDAVKDKKNVKPIEVLKDRLRLIRQSAFEEEKSVLYIGKTDKSLRGRIYCFARYGYGEVKNHRGGYPLWQIKDNKKLLVEIFPFKDSKKNPKDEETRLLDEYIDRYGTEPLANTAVGRNSKYRYIRKTDKYILRK